MDMAIAERVMRRRRYAPADRVVNGCGHNAQRHSLTG